MLIAQISDTHVKRPGKLAYRQVDTNVMLKDCVRHLLAFRPRPDLVLITGDLVDRGDPEEYQHLRELLAPLSLPLLVIPGNHDDRQALREAFADLDYLPGTGFLHYAVQRGGLHFIGLDTLVPGKGGGRLCEERLEWLEARLSEQSDCPTIVMMHHPPFETGIVHMDAQGLEGREAYAATVRSHPQIVATLCGHLHRVILAQVGGRPALTAPSPAHQVELGLDPDAPSAFRMEPPAFMLHRWTGHHLVSHQAFIGNHAGPFPFFDQWNRLID
jgi:Icc protein